MPYNVNQKILLVGAGLMAQEYVKVLNELKVDYDVVGRGEYSSKEFTEKTGKNVYVGGVESFFNNNNQEHKYSHAIVTTGIDHLSMCALTLLNNKIKHILIEKPGGINSTEIEKIRNSCLENNANVWVAYNRRFYSSTLHAKKIIEEDGGVSSFHFEFTEWSHIIEPLKTPELVKNNWFLANSSHVIDLAFYLGGKPRQLSSFKAGNLSWHKYSKYAGAGITDDNAVFSYHANWAAPGRWSVEILTAKHRLYFKPMETLQIQKIGTVNVTPVDIDDSLDKSYKPGLYKQTNAFLNGEIENFCTIEYQNNAMKWYNQMSGYDAN